MKTEFKEDTYPCHVPDRLLDDYLLTFDFPAIIAKVKNEDAWKKGDRNAITLLKSSNLRIVLIALKDQAEINFHHSGNLASVQLLEGFVNFKTENNTVILKKGSLLTFHDKVEHTMIAGEESVILLTISVCPANHL
jgi:quercetin dioxygenase-like cupin family protein